MLIVLENVVVLHISIYVMFAQEEIQGMKQIMTLIVLGTVLEMLSLMIVTYVMVLMQIWIVQVYVMEMLF